MLGKNALTATPTGSSDSPRRSAPNDVDEDFMEWVKAISEVAGTAQPAPGAAGPSDSVRGDVI